LPCHIFLSASDAHTKTYNEILPFFNLLAPAHLEVKDKSISLICSVELNKNKNQFTLFYAVLNDFGKSFSSPLLFPELDKAELVDKINQCFKESQARENMYDKYIMANIKPANRPKQNLQVQTKNYIY